MKVIAVFSVLFSKVFRCFLCRLHKTPRFLYKKKNAILCGFLVLAQLASPAVAVITYAASTTSNQVGSSAALDPVGNKATRLQTQGSSGVDQSTGAFTYSYPLTIPDGRNGMAPKLALSYNSQNNETGWFGYGWNMSIPYIERTTKTGTDKMYTNPVFVSSLHGELVSSDGFSYEQKIDDGSYARYTYTGNTWQMTDRDGITYYFGNTYTSRVQDDSGAKIGRWYINEVRDKFGNGIVYNYTKDGGNVYPSTISYTEHALAHPLNLVTFNLENKNDKTISYKYGFRVTDTKRVSYIKVVTNGRDNSYFTFNYTTGSNGVRSLLQFVEERHLGTNDDWVTLPKTSFEYENSPFALGGSISGSVNPYGGNAVVDTNNDGVLDLYSAGAEYFPIDINGDYKKDLMQSDMTYGDYSPNHFINFKYNNGAGFNLRSMLYQTTPNYIRYMITGSVAPPLRVMPEGTGVYGQESVIVDLNGDGFDDIMYNDQYGGNGVGINTTNNSFNYPQASGLATSIADTLVDINGDGLTDKIVKSFTATSTLFTAFLNNGIGYESTSTFTYDAKIAQSGFDIGVRFTDVNNDGLIDVVRSYTSNYTSNGPACSTSYSSPVNPGPINQSANEIAINTGYSFAISSTTLSGYLISYETCSYGLTPNFLVTKTSKEYDTNGDLTTDYDGATNNTAKQDVLKKVTSSLGSTSDVSYTWTTKTGLNPTLPVPMYIVTTTTDKLSASDQSPHVVGYSFYNGQMYFDASAPRDHKFAGFGKVEVVDGKNKTTTYYHQGNGDDYTTGEKGDSYYSIGRPYRADTFDLSTGTSTLVSKNLSLYTTYSYASSSFTYLDSQVSSSYNTDGSFLSSGNKNVYDLVKRLIKTSYNYGDIEPFTSFASSTITDKGADILTTQYQYSNVRPQRLVKQVTTDYAGNTISNTIYYYDNLPLGLVDKGAVTSVFNTVYKDDGTVSATSTTQTVYDATGNVIQTIDNLNRKTSVTYDSSYFFPVTKVDALNGTTTFTYDPYTLNLLTTKGPDGITFVKETDGLGKATRVYTINNGGGISDEVKTSYVYGGGLSVYSRKLGVTGTSAQSFQAYDSYGRLIQSKSETTPDVFSTQDTIYDASSNVISTSLPYTTTGYGLTGDTPSNGNTVYTYDGLGRVTTKSSFGTTLSYQYGARSLIVQDNASTQHKKSYVYDASGNLSQVNEYNGGTTYTTNYNYTPFNKLSRITDANENIRNFSYLTNGSLTYQEDPHTPSDTTFTTYSYTYDSLGNLITKAGQLGTTTYAYDSLNRPTSRTLSDVNYGTSTVSITYTGCSNNYSLPCTISRGTSSTTLAYNVSGKLSSESLSIDGNTFIRSYAYDTFGNPTTITYPDNGKTVYTYTLDGKQSTLSYITPSGTTKNIVTNSTYNSLGALSSLSYGNGVQMCNTYTSTSADGTISPKLAKSSYLFNTTGCSAAANQIELYKDEFTYKDSITPSAVLSTYKDIAGVTHTKSDTFTYDNLARLTQVTTSYDGGAAINDVLTYDPIGNILKENDVLYRYSQDGTQNAHAVTSVGGMHVAYDAQGNRIQVGDSAYAWNALNQMVSATSTSGTEFYTYDENGERIKKVVKATSVTNQKVTPSTSTSTLTGFRSGDLLAQVATSSIYIATSTYNTLSSLSLLSTSTLTTLVSNYYSSPFTSKFCATATSTSNRQNCIVTTTQQLLANNINSRGTSTVATTGLVNDVINIVTGAYLIPLTYTGLATSSIATSATTTFTINGGTISSYNTYVATGIVVPMVEYANLPYVSSSTYTTLTQVGLTDTSKVRALLTLSGCNSVSSACTTAEKVVFERTYKNNGYLLSDKVLQEMWYVFAAKARLPGNGGEFTATSTTLGSITVPTITGLTISSATSTYYSGKYFTTEYTNQNTSEPRLQFFNTIPYYVTQSAFTELQQVGITQATLENYQALIGDLFGIKAASSTEYMAALTSFVQYDKKATLSYNAIKELYLVVLGAATIPNNVSDYTATSIFDLSGYLTLNSYQYNGYTGTWPFYASGCYAGWYSGSGSSPWTRCVITTSSFTLPVATSSTVSYILTVSKTPQPTEWPLVVGNSVSISGGINQGYTATVLSDGSHLDADVSPTIVARLAGSTSTVMVANSHEFVTGTVYPYQAESVALKAYVSTPRLTLASTTLVSSVTQYATTTIVMVSTSSIAAYYKLDNSSGVATNSVGSGALPNYGPTAFSSGKINNGTNFGAYNETKSFYTAYNFDIYGGAITMSAWFKPDTLASGQGAYIVFQGDGGTNVNQMIYYENSAGTYRLWFNRQRQNVANDGTFLDYTLNVGTWYHLVYTYDGSNIRGYVNGSLVYGPVASSGNGGAGGGWQMNIGGYYAYGTQYKKSVGMVDEVGLWRRALSGSEVMSLYNNGSGLQYPFLGATSTEIIATSTYTAGIQSAIGAYFGEIYDSSSNIITASTTASSSLVFISPESYAEFASTTLRDSYAISKVFLATSTPWCASNASTTECDKQARKTFFRTTIGNLSGFIPSQAATEEFWMVHKGILTLPNINFASTTGTTTVPGYYATSTSGTAYPGAYVVSVTPGYYSYEYVATSTATSTISYVTGGTGFNSNAGTASTATYSFNATSSPNTMLFACIDGGSGYAAGIQYNGAPFTGIGSHNNGWCGYLANPTPGVHNFTLSFNSNTPYHNFAYTEYTGIATSSLGASGVGYLPTINTTIHGSYIIGGANTSAGSVYGSPNIRVTGGTGSTGNYLYMMDKMVPNPSSVTIGISGGGSGGGEFGEFKPAVIVTPGQYQNVYYATTTTYYIATTTAQLPGIFSSTSTPYSVFSRQSLPSSLSTTTSLITSTTTIPGYWATEWDSLDYIATSTATSTGGAITKVGSSYIHTFTSSGIFSTNDTFLANVLVLGGGGASVGGTGGGGGQYSYTPNVLMVSGAHSVSVGLAGGTSTFDTTVALKGGDGNGTTFVGGSSMGFVGGAGASNAAGGGAGAGENGKNNSGTYGGLGGNGFINPISGSTHGEYSNGNYYLAGGGGGYGDVGQALGGLGGGGRGNTGGVATANFGGGAGSYATAGSGVVIVSYDSVVRPGFWMTVHHSSTTPVYIATSTTVTVVKNLSLVPSGLLSDLQYNSLYSTSTFARTASTRIVSEDTYNELLNTPIRTSSDVDTVFGYSLSFATSTCSGQLATSQCVVSAQKTKVKNTIAILSGFLISDTALEELYKVYTNELSIVPLSLDGATTTTASQNIILPLAINEALITFSTTTVGTSTSLTTKNSVCSFGISGATTSRCYIDLPYINSTVTGLSFSYDVSTSSVATSTLRSYLTYDILSATTTSATATPSILTISTTTTIIGQKISSTKFTFDISSLYGEFLRSSSPKLVIVPDANGTSSMIYNLSNPTLSISRTVMVPKVNYKNLTIIATSTLPYEQVISTSSLQAYYKMDDVNDVSGNNRTLSNVNSLNFSSGLLAGGARFDTTNKKLELAGNAGFTATSSNTWSVWFKPTTLTSGYIVDTMTQVGGQKRVLIHFDATVKQFRTWISGRSNPGVGPVVSLGNWYHVALVNNSGVYTLYVNGVSYGVQGTSTSSTGAVDWLSVGAPIGGSTSIPDATIDEFSIWSRALSSGEISSLYNNGIGLQYPFKNEATNSAGLVPFDRGNLPSVATTTATTTIDLTSAPTLDLSTIFLSPVARISSNNSSYTTNVMSTSSLRAYYKLDEVTGNAIDATGNGYTLTNNGATSYSVGKVNNGADFGSTNTAKHFSTFNDLGIDGGPITISAWVKIASPVTSSPGVYYFVNQGGSSSQVNNIIAYYYNGGSPRVSFNRQKQNITNNEVTSTITLTPGVWYHLVQTYNGTTLQAFINGVSVGTLTTSGNGVSAANDSFSIGSMAANGSFYPNSNGIVDEVAVFNRALTPTEVLSLYNNGQALSFPFQLVTTTATSTLYAGSLIDPTYAPLPTVPQNALPAVVYPSATSTATTTLNQLTSATTTTTTIYTPFSGFVEDSRGVVTTYLTLNGTLVGAYSYQKGNEASTGKITFAHTNYLGTPVLETDDKGDIVQMDITDVFGNYVHRDQRNDNAYHSKTYTGHEFDDTTGNIYARARYLNSPAHTFLSVDPMLYKTPVEYLQDPQQMNSYAYARNNPVIYTDPDGKFILPLLAAAAIVSIVAANVLPVYYALTNAPTPQLQASIGVQQSVTGIFGSMPIKGGGAYNSFANPSTGAVKTTSNTAIVGKTSTPAPKASTGVNISGSNKQSLPEVTVSRSRYPEASQHIQDAQASGKPSVLTIDRAGATDRRQSSLNGIPTQSGYDRDEYPPAMFKEGGSASSVRYINPRDNRGAGSCIGIQCRDYPDGTQIELKVIDY